MKNLYFLLLVLVGTSNFAKAQSVDSYHFKHKAGVALERLPNPLFLLNAAADNQLSPSISFFPFTFAGTSYNHFSVSEDGVVVLGGANYHPYQYDNYFKQAPAVSGKAAAYPILLPWGEDLYTSVDGSVVYQITGAAPSRKLVIEYKVRSAEDNIENYNKTFQVWLFESSNQIQFVYGDVAAEWYNNANIGLAASSADYLSVNSATHTASSTEIALNSDGQYPDKKASLPGSGTAYLFSPTAIADETPFTATVSILPEYTVASQQKHTIYLGYGVQSVTLNTQVFGRQPSSAGFTYAWSPATGLSDASAASPVASPTVTTDYTVAITDGNGGTTSQKVTVYVLDPRFGDKFKVCKTGKTTICISKEAVDVQLAGGATLGACPSSSVSDIAPSAFQVNGAYRVQVSDKAVPVVYPNPSAGVVYVQLPESSQQRVLEFFDINGKRIVQKAVSEKEQTIRVILSGNAPGVYLMKVSGNGSSRTSKIIIK